MPPGPLRVYPGLEPDENGLVGVGGVLTPAFVVEMVRQGAFPWTGEHPIPWFSPDPRMILLPAAFKTTRSLEKRARNSGLEVRFDTAFRKVMRACAETERRGEVGTWITPNMLRTYGALFDQGLAHCVEVWDGPTLVGGLYGLSLGRAFFGESMFHHRPDASKLALRALCHLLVVHGFDFIDAQQETAHLASLGAIAVPRATYLERLAATLLRPPLPGPWTSLVSV